MLPETVPDTWLQVLVVLVVVVPGFVYQIARRRVAGPSPDEVEVSIRVLRAIASSAVFACVYGILLGPRLVRLAGEELTSTWLVENIQLLSAGVLVLVLVVPWLAARVTFYVATATWWAGPRRALAWLTEKLGVRHRWDPTPSAWDFAFSHAEPGWVRVLTADGRWVGGYFGRLSFASSYPDPQELFVEVGYAMGDDGQFTDQISAPSGVFIRCSDAILIDFIPDEAVSSGASSGDTGDATGEEQR